MVQNRGLFVGPGTKKHLVDVALSFLSSLTGSGESFCGQKKKNASKRFFTDMQYNMYRTMCMYYGFIVRDYTLQSVEINVGNVN